MTAQPPRKVVEITNDSREAFEQLQRSRAGFVPFDLSKENSRYWNTAINEQWEAWQAALAWADSDSYKNDALRYRAIRDSKIEASYFFNQADEDLMIACCESLKVEEDLDRATDAALRDAAPEPDKDQPAARTQALSTCRVDEREQSKGAADPLRADVADVLRAATRLRDKLTRYDVANHRGKYARLRDESIAWLDNAAASIRELQADKDDLQQRYDAMYQTAGRQGRRRPAGSSPKARSLLPANKAGPRRCG